MARKTAAPKTGSIDQVDPRTLTVSDNVRTETTVTPEFVASIKENGVLSPPMVTPNEDGTYEIVFGHRRTLAAIEAGLDLIDVYVVPKDEAEAARLVDQLAENDQRQELTEAERVGGYKKLALIGLSPAQIAKRTTTPRATVDTSLAIADNEVAVKALAEHQVTLLQAAAIVEFSDDKAAVKRLTDQAEKDPTRFDHAVAEVRAEQQLKDHKKELQKQLEATTTVQLAATPNWDSTPSIGEVTMHGKMTRIELLARPTDPTTPLTADDIEGKDGIAGKILTGNMDKPGVGYGNWARIQYFVLDEHLEAKGFVPREYSRPAEQPRERTPEEQAEHEAREAASALAAEQRAARDLATTVRRAFVGEFLQRPTMPADSINYIAWGITFYGELYYGDIDDQVIEWLGLAATDGEDADGYANGYPNQKALHTALAGRPKLAQTVVLAIVLHMMDSTVAGFAPTANLDAIEKSIVITHLEQLRSWGYGLSEAEQAIVDAAKAAPADEQDAEAGE